MSLTLRKKIEELKKGITAVKVSPSGESYFDYRQCIIILDRCDSLDIAASSPEVYTSNGGGGVLDLSRDLTGDRPWIELVREINQRVRSFLDEFSNAPSFKCCFVVFGSPEDGDFL